MSDTFERACALSDVPDEGVVAAEVGGVEVAVVKSEGQIFAVRDECSHAQIQLSDEWRYSRLAEDLGLTEEEVQKNLNLGGGKIGDHVISPMSAEMGLAAFRAAWGSASAVLPHLSAREAEIALHVARGLTTPHRARPS